MVAAAADAAMVPAGDGMAPAAGQVSDDQCGAIMPGTDDRDVDASVPEFRCLLPAGHDSFHATIIEWNDEWPWFLERDGRLEREASDTPPLMARVRELAP